MAPSVTVKDLVIGSNMKFADCGTFELKVVPGRGISAKLRHRPNAADLECHPI